MHLFRLIGLGCSAALIALSIAEAAAAQDRASLPGGATSLREIHGDWIVACALQGAGGKSSKACTLSEELTDTKSRQRVLAIEFRPASSGIEGTLILPFGLDLAKGASLQIDGGAAATPIAFRTCLPAGCIIPVSFDAKTLTALRNASTLKVKTMRDGGADMQFAISLKGFGGAFDRTAALLK